jgi:hypothetical protein
MKRTSCNLTIEQKMSESRSAQILCIVSSTHVSSAEFARLSTCCKSDRYYLEIAARARSVFFFFFFFFLVSGLVLFLV